MNVCIYLIYIYIYTHTRCVIIIIIIIIVAIICCFDKYMYVVLDVGVKGLHAPEQPGGGGEPATGRVSLRWVGLFSGLRSPFRHVYNFYSIRYF